MMHPKSARTARSGPAAAAASSSLSSRSLIDDATRSAATSSPYANVGANVSSSYASGNHCFLDHNDADNIKAHRVSSSPSPSPPVTRNLCVQPLLSSNNRKSLPMMKSKPKLTSQQQRVKNAEEDKQKKNAIKQHRIIDDSLNQSATEFDNYTEGNCKIIGNHHEDEMSNKAHKDAFMSADDKTKKNAQVRM